MIVSTNGLSSQGLPTRSRGRQTAEAAAKYRDELQAFAARVKQIRSGLEFAPSSRGWAYVLEGEGMITKGQFGAAQRLINACRKDGTLPLNICSEDDRREAEGLERALDWRPEAEIDFAIDHLLSLPRRYKPISFWEGQDCYIEMAVEKVDLKHLFAPVCRKFRIPIQNIAGWTDLHCRANMMVRFAEHEAEGRRAVLLYAGDHDPGGLNISSFLRANFEDLGYAVGWWPDNLIIDRFGLDYDFIQELGLTWLDNLETSSGTRLDNPKHPDHHKPYVQNYLRKFGARKVEANALIVRPTEGRELCRRAILKYLPATALREYLERLIPHQEEIKVKLADRIMERLGEGDGNFGEAFE